MKFLCPVCNEFLEESLTSYKCVNNHSFDKAKTLYLNLLLNSDKKSKHPGDDKDMIKSRSLFLNSGFYESISNLLNENVNNIYKRFGNIKILDIGCGEGYYIYNLKNFLHNKVFEFAGIDISKEAIIQASKRRNNILWVVGNAKKLPFMNEYFDCMISVFSPFFESCFDKLKKDGYIFQIVPMNKHLLELKTLFYDKILDKNKEQTNRLDKLFNLNLLTTKTFQKVVNIVHDDIINLLKMTPHFWRIKKEKMKDFLLIKDINITIDIALRIYKK